MRILIFNAYYEPEIIASRYLTTNLYEAMANHGWQVHLYIPVPTRGVSNEIRNEYAKKKLEYKCNGNLVIHRVSLPKETKGLIRRAARYLLMDCIFFVKALFSTADLIFVQSTPPTLGATAALVKQIKSIPFVYALHDVFPDSLITAGITSHDSMLWKIGSKIEKFTFAHCDKVIAISQDIANNLHKKGVSPENVTVIPNWVESDKVHPVDRCNNILLPMLNLDMCKFYVVYAGNLGRAQNIEVILKCAVLMSDLPQICFLIFGSGNLEEEYRKMASDLALNNLKFYPMQPYELVKYVYSLGDIGLVTCRKGAGSGALPSKTWSIMSCSRPVLANFDKGSELEELIKAEKLGTFTKTDDVESMKSAILKYWQSPEITREEGSRGRSYVEKHLTREICVKRYIETIAEVGER